MSGPAALVLAGTRPGGDPFANELALPHKALIELEGETLLARVVGALHAAGIERVLVSCASGPVADLACKLGAEVIPAEAGPSASVAAGFDRAGAPLLVTTSDHGLLKSAWVREIVEGTGEGCDLSVMLAERARVEAAVPGSKRTYLRFADGHWSGCNLFYLRTPAARRALDIWSMVEADRKRPWRIAARLGPATLVSMLLGRLTMSEALERLGRKIGVSACLVPASDGLAAVDIDKQADLDLVRALLAAR
ncbi:nucleotidyltransferase family protein [Qipengyuania aurantiaca]|uniref:Nucleotidyltransferase family protein n=1 Tax=Qipengyuania aurantiaca TaxID=2867233 RepID=A0ABX8ZL33_9SPHN|nr:nucleotidyltransferase family protein [Qipengyuania aurantiaca]QZD89672.1 nucleotidyltransferase family protein [Qipengyuania aurantiaca]